MFLKRGFGGKTFFSNVSPYRTYVKSLPHIDPEYGRNSINKQEGHNDPPVFMRYYTTVQAVASSSLAFCSFMASSPPLW